MVDVDNKAALMASDPNASPLSLVDLALRRVLDGDREAFEPVVRSEAAFLGSWVRLRCAPGLDPDDIVQKSFIAAYEQLSSYQLGTNFRAWLCRIAYHRMLSAARDQRRRQRLEVEGLDLERVDKRCWYITEETCDQERQALRSCLEQLQPHQQELLALRYSQGIAVQDIAERLQRTPSALSKSLCLLRGRLRDCIQRKMQQMNHWSVADALAAPSHEASVAATPGGRGSATSLTAEEDGDAVYRRKRKGG